MSELIPTQKNGFSQAEGDRDASLPDSPSSPNRPNRATRGILCVKCESLNDTDAEKCKRCGTHLFVFCHRCGHKNTRVNSRCENCQRRLHRTVRSRLEGKHGVQKFYIALAALAIVGIILTLLWAAELLPFLKK